MTETVEYTAANLSDAQKAWCAKVEAEREGTQCRIDRFEPDGSVYVHVHGAGPGVQIVLLGEDGVPHEQVLT